MGLRLARARTRRGYSLLGTHFLMKGPKGATLNIHLGPVGVVDFVAKELVEGQAVEVKAFRTVGMKAGHYVACTVSTKGRRVTLRDSTLRPAWAGGRWGAGGPTTTGIGYGRGGGPGWQRGWLRRRSRARPGMGTWTRRLWVRYGDGPVSTIWHLGDDSEDRGESRVT